MRKLLLLIFLLLNATTFVNAQQSRQVSGLVTDNDTGTPIPGVSVTVKGTGQGVQTDGKGNYKLNIPTGKQVTLSFNFIGYKPSEIVVGDKSVINIILQSDNIQLKNVDVVSIGYSTVKRRDLTGSVSSISAKQLQDNPVNSAAEILNGKLAGVEVTSAEGAPDAQVRIRVRGSNSITQDGAPLYVIDGIIVESGLTGLSPQDIESVDVLKDASATSIYGARGSNGVILVTTKGGKAMKTRVSYNGLFGLNKLANELKVMSPYDFVMFQYELDPTIPGATLLTNFQKNYGSTWDTLSVYKTIPSVDWQKEVMGRNAFYQTHIFNITGGDAATQFNLSLTDNSQQGVLINSDLTRRILNFRVDHTANEHLKYGFNARYNNQLVDGNGTSDAGASQYNNLRNVVKYVPFLQKSAPIDQFDPAYYQETTTGLGLSLINPIALINAQTQTKSSNFTNLNGYLSYTIAKDLTFKSTLGIETDNATSSNFQDYFTPRAISNGGSLPMVTVITNKSFSLDNANTITYNKTFGGHTINLLLGQEYYDLTNSSLNNSLKFFPLGITPDKAFGNLSLGTDLPLYPTNSGTESNIMSYFGRVNYNYKSKYFLTLSSRIDQSSKFSENNRTGFFPSGAIAWRVSSEDFMKKLTFIDDLKLRASIGETGNNRIGDYLFETTFTTPDNYPTNEVPKPGYVSANLSNENLKWETTISKNVGIDLSVLKGRLQITADAYYNTTNDLLVNVPIPSTSGYTTQLQNVGSILNKGLEFQLNGTIIQSKDFSYSANFNIAFNANKILKLSGNQTSFFAFAGLGSAADPADYEVKVGQPVGTMYGFVVDGKGGDGTGFYTVNDFNYNTATGAYTLKAGLPDPTKAVGVPQPGMIKYKDMDGNGVIDNNDRTIIGNPNPKFTGGFSQTLTYKGFDATVFVNFEYGQSVYNANKVEFTNSYTHNTNLLSMMDDRWRTVDQNTGQRLEYVIGSVAYGVPPDQLAAANQNAKIWIPVSGQQVWAPNTWSVEDGSFLRINNVTLGYSFSPKLLSRVKIYKLRIYATANNLALVTNYTGYDPQVNTRQSSPLTPNVDYSAYPRTHTYVVGINVTL